MKKPKHVQRYKNRHRRWRTYFRKPGAPLAPLPEPIFSDAFWTAYHKALAGEPAKAPGALRVKVGSLAALIAEYYQSADYKALAESTKGAYRRVLDGLRQEHGEKPVVLLETK